MYSITAKYKVMAVSKENQRYVCTLTVNHADELSAALEAHIKDKGWSEYEYRVESFTLVIPEKSNVGINR